MANLTEEQKKAYRETKEKILGKYDPCAKKDENGQYYGQYKDGIMSDQINDIKSTAKNEGVGSAILSVLGKIILGGAYLLLGGK